MKPIYEFLQISNGNKLLNTIDNEMLFEALQEPHLIQLAQWLKQFKHKSAWESKSFNTIVAGRFAVAWDQITADSFDTYEAGDKNGIKEAVKVNKRGDGYENYLILFIDDEDHIQFFINCNGIYALNNNKFSQEHPKLMRFDVNGNYKYMHTDYDHVVDVPKQPSNHADKVSQKDIRDLCAKYKFMILHLDQYQVDMAKKRNERWAAKQGVITPDKYSEIARQNRQRYKEIINKRKAERLAANDTLPEEVEATLNAVLELSKEVMKGGAKYADLDYKMSSLLRDCYDKRAYVGYTRQNPTGYTGYDGLLSLFATYMSGSFSAHKGYDANTTQRADAIHKKIEKINKAIEEIRKLM